MIARHGDENRRRGGVMSAAMSAAWPHAVGTIRSKLVFLFNVRAIEPFAERSIASAAERGGHWWWERSSDL